MRASRSGAALEGHDVSFAAGAWSNLASAGWDARAASAEVLFGQPDPARLLSCPRLRWIHLTSAGHDRYDDLGAALAARGVALTTSAGVYAEPCAQHLLAMMLSLARRLPEAHADQLGARAWDSAGTRSKSRILAGQTVLLLGHGSIGRRLVELLAPFALRVIALRRRPRGDDEGVEVIGESALEAILPEVDHLVSSLPGGPATRGFVSAARLARLPPHACFYNVGRGSTVDQEALVAALEAGRLGGAYLDVTEPEPLPPEHALWRAPRCYVTPHAAGGHAEEMLALVEHFGENLRRLLAGAPLLHRVA
jgi:phosphoglycerate dehydrogenase-like enzyme